MGQKINIVMDQGATFTTTFNVVDNNNLPIDLSHYTAASEMRKTYFSSNAYSFSATGYANGAITLTMNAATTSAIWAGRYVYDIDITDQSGNVSRVIEGIVTVTPGVTYGVR
jgi:hypothetical protein